MSTTPVSETPSEFVEAAGTFNQAGPDASGEAASDAPTTPTFASLPEPRVTASDTAPRSVNAERFELLHNVEMAVTAELGRTRMTVRDLLSLMPGTVVELDRAAGSPVDLFVNGTLLARGEVVVIDEEFGIRISEIVSSSFEGPAGA
jgi:flagellar motor switch protein FliN/FliY